jgi:hypothetical protein
MIYVFDVLTEQYVYINLFNVIYATRNNDIEYYDIYLNGDSMIKVHEVQFLKIKEELNQCQQ